MGRLNEGRDDSGPVLPGGTRTITTNDGKVITVYRTNRPYACDLADAYNAAMDPAAKARGAEWFVTEGGELRLGHSEASIRQNGKRERERLETERARHLRRQFDPVV